MHDELRTILLHQADQIVRCAGVNAAEQIMGFRAEGQDGFPIKYSELASERVDLGRFEISPFFDRAYDFAFQPSLEHTIYSYEVASLFAFMDGAPRMRAELNLGDLAFVIPRPNRRIMTEEGYCQTVVDATVARWKLENHKEAEFTPRELALLANMSEGAVRNAMSDKGPNALKPIPGSKPIQVAYDEAMRWLSERKGFVFIQVRPSESMVFESLDTVRTAENLGRLIETYLRVFDSTGGAANPRGRHVLGWSDDELKHWMDGSFQFDPAKARKVAEALEFDVPLFVGKALEVCLRRDNANARGDQS